MLIDNTLHDFRFFNVSAKTGELVNTTPRATQTSVSTYYLDIIYQSQDHVWQHSKPEEEMLSM